MSIELSEYRCVAGNADVLTLRLLDSQLITP
jgi:hypothetical protein